MHMRTSTLPWATANLGLKHEAATSSFRRRARDSHRRPIWNPDPHMDPGPPLAIQRPSALPVHSMIIIVEGAVHVPLWRYIDARIRLGFMISRRKCLFATEGEAEVQPLQAISRNPSKLTALEKQECHLRKSSGSADFLHTPHVTNLAERTSMTLMFPPRRRACACDLFPCLGPCVRSCQNQRVS